MPKISGLETPFVKTGTVAINETITLPTSGASRLRIAEIRIKFDIAPTTAGNLVLKEDDPAGATFDFNHLTKDMATVGKDYSNEFEPGPIRLNTGSALDIDYANPDGRTWTMKIFYSLEV